ncbi:hypothetical protein [Bdellovibrio sp. HCB337]|uniref:hypothetical protein n=1 Tax=Bdellovibrio sp. HCB337 TaxID=3394358 RepID=UPI0039A53D78
MKKLIFTTLALVLGFGGFGLSEAKAETGAPLWVCQMGFKGNASGFKILFGKYEFHGTGQLNCVNIIGQTVSYPINLDMKAKPLSLGVAIGKYKMYGQALEISLFNCDPDELLGKYMIAQTHATIIGGVGAFTAVKLGNPQLALEVSLQFTKGFGLDLSLNQLRISEREEDSDDAEPN